MHSAFPSVPDHAGWYTGNDGVVRNVMGHHGPRPDNRVCPDVDTWQNTGVHPDICSKAHHDRLDHEASCDNRLGIWYTCVDRTEHLGARSPADVVFQNQVPSIEVGLWTNPNMAADPAGPIETPLDHGLRPYKNAVAKLHRLRVLQDDVSAHLKVVADPVAQGAHENAAHHRVESTLSGPEVAEQIQQ